ncbi:AraC family transcriptional regulator [Zhouia sp. PK063]|uniref:AraC family transcriptional regulator n=1 Tax=Zhouia sp. PK063 TaxID=3373602 RepID=UPI0037998D0E
MKLHFLQKNLSGNIHITKFEDKEFLKLWHYHPEHELVYIIKGNGTLYTGDYIGSFKANDIFYFGKNTPHMFDSNYIEHTDNKNSKAISIHINHQFMDEFRSFSKEFSYINKLVKNSNRGIQFDASNNEEMSDMFHQIQYSGTHETAIKFMLILLKLYNLNTTSIQPLATPLWLKHYSIADKRLNQIIQYIMQNFQSNITLETIANISGMNESAFCRYFKANTDKSFITFINELRINYACKLLKETNPEKTISEACFQSGFNSLSYFNRTFKKIMNTSPSNYKLHCKTSN